MLVSWVSFHRHSLKSAINDFTNYNHPALQMCVQYRGVAQYRVGVQYCGGYHEYRGDILSTVGGVQYRGGYHDKCGDILSTVGCSVPWGIS